MKSALKLMYYFLLSLTIANCIQIKEWELPILPKILLTSYNAYNFSLNNDKDNKINYKKVPRNIWIAVRETTDIEALPKHLKEFLERNKNWNVNIVSNAMKDDFMNKTFAKTSLLWAYNMINPLCGAAKADIWFL